LGLNPALVLLCSLVVNVGCLQNVLVPTLSCACASRRRSRRACHERGRTPTTTRSAGRRETDHLTLVCLPPRLLVYIACFVTYPFLHFFLTYFLPYLSFPLIIDPLRFQAGCRKRRLVFTARCYASSKTVQDRIDAWFLLKSNRKSYALYRMVALPMTLSAP